MLALPTWFLFELSLIFFQFTRPKTETADPRIAEENGLNSVQQEDPHE